MRLLIEIVIIGGLIYFGWEKPFKEWRNQVRATVTSKQETASQGSITTPAVPPPTPIPQHGAWMWDPNHRSALDRPAYDQTGAFGAVPSGTPPKYRDASGRTYWIDAQGVPHYDQQ